MTTVLNAVSAGTITVAKKGGKIVVEAAKKVKLKGDFDPSLNVQTNGFSLPPKTTPKVINIKGDQAIKGTKEYDILDNPPANIHVKLDNGTEFKTNTYGRVDEVEFQPSLTKNPRDSRQTAVGKQGDKGDVGGHIQACSLGGTCDNFNLFPQNSNFNNSAYKKWENEIRGALKNGDTVGKVKVSFNRTKPSNLRPDSLEVEYSINGKVKNKFFRNEANDK
ncbi:DNA/RNA non-specific endonuclease [Acinetobacter baumannii]